MNEQELIQQVASGDTDAFAPLVERYHVGLIIYCEQFTHDRAAAEDIAQDAFIKAYRTIKKYHPEKGRFSTWLYRIARSCALDYCRAQKMAVDIDTMPDIENVTHDLSDAEKSEVRAAVTSLQPPIYRQVIEAFYWDGKSYQTIAHEHNLPINTVRTHLRRAKVKLQGALS